jgi:dTDP-4-dehydrorhamnose reductase
MSTPRLRLVVLGSGGRLGAAVARYFSEEAQVIPFNHSQLDLSSLPAIENALAPLPFDALINCAAQTNVDRCETHPEEAFAINATAVGRIGEICSQKNARCVHVSTDYVFDGLKKTPYTEEDEPKPISVYGQSKRDGEVLLTKTSQKHLSVRVSWVFGPDRPSFVDQILKRALEAETLQAIGDKWSAPTYTLDLAQMLHPLVYSDAVQGLLHLANKGGCTWQEYGQFALDCAAAAKVPLKARAVAFQAMSDLKAFIAKRPVYTVLGTYRLEKETGIIPRPWQEAVSEYVRHYYAKKC